MRRCAVVALLVCLPAVPTWAEPATRAGADGIAAALGRLLPAAPGTLAVTPSGDRYVATLDLGALLPEKKITLTLRFGSVGAAACKLDFEGRMDIGPGQAPVGRARIALDGIEAVLAVLNAGPEEVKGDAVPGLPMMRGPGRAESPDKVSWETEMTPKGKLLMNGNDLPPMMGR
ncbi:hypothetical protein [Frigidibacter sp. ROC022]|uniref:hypothetical protein n=1 Tax=Frigidibacter sp. ROC022 TaxID=2971796 RepID=UPI00215B47E2|nr:hypothetical protein [Frigidibacter sp. ROC022]MCR8726071.1 hypothetical protein [Frigidibacter sp. ROC022]